MALTDRQILFVHHYLSCFNATKAALMAGYSARTARSMGSENLTKPDILAAINARLEEVGMQADEIIARLSIQARGDMSDFVRVEESEGPDGKTYSHVIPDLHAAYEAGKLGLVKSFTMNKNGMRFEMYDSQAALTTLARIRGLMEADKPQGSGDVPPLPDGATLARFADFIRRRQQEEEQVVPATSTEGCKVLPDDVAGEGT